MRMLHDFDDRRQGNHGGANDSGADHAAGSSRVASALPALIGRAGAPLSASLTQRLAAPVRDGAIVLAASLLLFALGWADLLMVEGLGPIATVWFANGVAVALLLRSPRRLLLPLATGLLAAGTAANLLHALPFARAVLISVADLVEIGCVVLMMRGALSARAPFDGGTLIGRYIGASLAGATAGAIVAAAGLALLEHPSVAMTAEARFVANLFGLLIVGPLLLSLPVGRDQWREASPYLSPFQRVERLALIGGILGMTTLLFWQDQAPYLFVLGPLLVLAGLRLSLFAACATILAAAVVAIAQTARGLGPVAGLSDTPDLQLFALQSLVASMIILVLPVRALVADRVRLGVAADLSERKFVRIAQASVAGIMHVDRQGQPTWANDRWARFAPARHQPGGDSWVAVVADDARDRLLSLWTRVRATMQPVSGEFPAVRGSVARWIALSIHPELGCDAVPNGFVIRVNDITERRTAEEQLAESERRYRLVTDNVSDLVVRLDREATILFASNAADRMLGLKPDLLEGRVLREFIHGEDWHEVQRGLSDLYGGGAAQVDLRLRQRCADGQFRWVEASLRPILEEGSDQPRDVIASLRDISQRIRTEQIVAESAAKLRESNRLISLAEDLAGVGHWRLDRAARGFDYSIQVNRIAGVARRETLSARGALRLLEADDRRTILATIARARRADRACECEVVVRAHDGERRRVCVVVRADRGHGGEVTGMIGVVRDVTAERRAHDELVRARDRAKAAAQAKARFLATMSHEIRTPMTGVMGMIDLLSRDPAAIDRSRYLDMLRTSADLLLAVLDDILDFSKIDSGRLLLEKRAFSLDRLLEETAALFERRANDKGLDLRFVHDGEPCAVVGDAMRLRQVVTNLLSNAIKFSERGTILLSLETEPREGRTAARILVRDEGIGIDPALHDDLFDPFVQADESTSRRFGGTGLGLAICRRLIDAMGGKISLVSAPGEGASFTVDLDLPSASIAEVAPSPPPVRVPPTIRGLSLLVAEDNPVNQMLIGAILRADGHQVETVENGRLAVEAAARTAFDAIIMDMQMPEMDGLAATRAIRASHGPCATVPILALTADASPERRRFYDGAGLSAFLTKPIDQEALTDQLRTIARYADPARDCEVAAPDGDGSRPDDAPETLNEGASAPLVNPARLAEIEAVLGEGHVRQLLALLDTELARTPVAIERAIGAGDRDQVVALAHGLKGAAGNIGAEAVASLARSFEQPGADLHDLAQRMASLAARTRKALDVLTAPPARTANG